jgi:hypothetical protein
MPLWAIENEDEAGEGLFIVDAPNRNAAFKIYRLKEGKTKVTVIYLTEWISLATVTGERGETYYFEQRSKKVKYTVPNGAS